MNIKCLWGALFLMLPAWQSWAAPSPQITTQARFNDLAGRCSSDVHPNTLQAIARVESRFNPYAIGVVRGSLKRQPATLAEAVATAKSLHAQGKNFSMGLMQINRYNLAAYGLTYETVFEPCRNIHVGAKILKSCFDRAGGNGQAALQKAFSCYYSGNFRFGFKSDFKGQPPYVSKVMMAARDNSPYQTIRGQSGKPQSTWLVKTGYVPQPDRSQSISVLQAEQQAGQQNSAAREAAVKPEGNPTTRKSADWDVFKDF